MDGVESLPVVEHHRLVTSARNAVVIVSVGGRAHTVGKLGGEEVKKKLMTWMMSEKRCSKTLF